MTSAHAYVDTCLLLSLFIGDSGSDAAEGWLILQQDQPLWISHWVLLEFAAVLSLCQRRGDLAPSRSQQIQQTFESFRLQRLSLLEPRSADFLQARDWIGANHQLALRSGDALHLALAKRHSLTIATADRDLVRAAEALHLPSQLIA